MIIKFNHESVEEQLSLKQRLCHGKRMTSTRTPDKNKTYDSQRHASASCCTNTTETGRCSSRFSVWGVRQGKRLGVRTSSGANPGSYSADIRDALPRGRGGGRLRDMKLTNYLRLSTDVRNELCCTSSPPCALMTAIGTSLLFLIFDTV